MDITHNGVTYRIEASDQCWTLSRVRVSKKTGAEYLSDTTYQTHFDAMADKLARMAVQDAGTQEITKTLGDMRDALAALLPPYTKFHERSAA